uniref:SLC22A3 n=1 Tax=Macrostomum lignano TaxID=282301 RepID=A0A1I8GZ68_9PLAT
MTLNFDDLLKQIGGFGRAQLLIFLVPALIAILSGFHTLAPIYLLYTPEYRCRPQSGIGSNRSTLNESVAQNLESIGKCSYGNETGPACHEWIYDQTEFASTFVTEVLIVLKYLIISLYLASNGPPYHKPLLPKVSWYMYRI